MFLKILKKYINNIENLFLWKKKKSKKFYPGTNGVVKY